MIIPVLVTIYTDRTFTFILKTPPASDSAEARRGNRQGFAGAEPQQSRQGDAQSRSKRSPRSSLPDLNTTNLDSAVRTVMGTARNMGLEVVEG